jgi:hypothetical protein
MPRPLQRVRLESGLKLNLNELAQRGFIRAGAYAGPVGKRDCISMAQRAPSYEIVRKTHSSFFVVRHHGGVSEVIERFETAADAENFFCFLKWVAEAPWRLAAH